nr:uncharacterized protein LOC129254952 [Lytechinus pictus]
MSILEGPSVPHFDTELSPGYGYVGTWEDAKAMKEFFEVQKALRFPAWRTSTTFGKTDILKGKRKKFKWAEAIEYVAGGAIPYDGVPYIILDKNVYECEYGVDHKLKKKALRGNQHHQENNAGGNKKKKPVTETEKGKKRNCPAKIRMKEIMKFPDFQIDTDTRYNRNKGADNINTAIAKGAVRGERRIYIYFPSDSEHKGHELRSQVCSSKQHVDERVLCLIDHLVEEGMTNADEISQQIRLSIQDAADTGIDSTHVHSRLSCPDDADIRYHVEAAMVIHTYSKLQPKDLEDHIAQLRLNHEDHNIFFRMQSFKDSLLLVHQTREQQQIIANYPTGKYFLDSTCKTTQGSFPLILISVQADDIPQIVGSIILQEKSFRLMQEALRILKSWNPTWKPLSFNTEYEEEDIQGIKKAFKGVPVLLCDYHRMYAWQKWITEASNLDISSKSALMSLFEAMSNASTKDIHDKLLDKLQGSSYWKEDEGLRKWFGSRWLPHSSMWAQALFPESSSQPSDNTPSDDNDDNDDDDDDDDHNDAETLRDRCLQSLQRLTNIAQQETISQQDLAHLAACLETTEEKYANLLEENSQEIAKQVEETQEQQSQVIVEGQESKEDQQVMEDFEEGSVKRMRVDADCVKMSNIEVGPEPIFLHMFVDAAEIEVPQEMVVSEVHPDIT